MQVFYAPFRLFILNVLVFVLLMFSFLFLGLGVYLWILIIFFIFTHAVIIGIGRKEPHIDNILMSRTNIRAKTENMLKEKGNKFST